MPHDLLGPRRQLVLPAPLAAPVLALGGQMKARLALGIGRAVYLSDDLGDLDTPAGREALAENVSSLQRHHNVRAHRLICDAHDGYTSTRWAKAAGGLPVTTIFHHHAHAGAVAGEFPGEPRFLCFTWDGVGLGPDGTLWGGEALLGMPGAWARVATFRPFAPPGGDRAGREPWRSAAALAWALDLDFSPPAKNVALAKAAWRKKLNCPETSAIGRLFDAAASFLNLVHDADFEAQGPIALEATALRTIAATADMADALALPLRRRADGVLQADWAPLVPMLQDATRPRAERAARFHASLALSLVAQAVVLRNAYGDFAVGLGGGVFQNKLLTVMVLRELAAVGFRAYLPSLAPCHDCGLSFGQLIEASAAP